jgi:hypothetical protein
VEAGPQQAVLVQPLQPFGVADVGLAVRVNVVAALVS